MNDELRPPVEVEFELDRRETATALRWHVLHQTGFRWKAALGVLSAGLLSLSFRLTGWQWISASSLGGIIFAVGTLLVLYVFPYVVAYQTPQLTQPYELIISHQGVKYRTEGADGHIEWPRYDDWTRSPDFFFLYYDDDQFTLIPRDVLPESHERRLEGFLQDYVTANKDGTT